MTNRQCNRKFVLLTLLCLLVCGCTSKEEPSSVDINHGKPQICVTTIPLKSFTQIIVGDFADVTYPGEDSLDIKNWTPDDAAIGKFQDADVVFINGSGLESWLNSVTIRERKIIDTGESLRDDVIELDAAIHQHGPEGTQTESPLVPATWLDPELAIRQAEVIRDSLIKLYPSEKDRFEQNYLELLGELSKAKFVLDAVATLRPDHVTIVTDPNLQYLVRAAGGMSRLIVIDPHNMPTDEQLTAIQNEIDGNQAVALLWSRQPDIDVDQTIRKTGLRSLVVDPFAKGNLGMEEPLESDYSRELLGIADFYKSLLD